jgi:hypothetical protein
MGILLAVHRRLSRIWFVVRAYELLQPDRVTVEQSALMRVLQTRFVGRFSAVVRRVTARVASAD